MFLHARHLRHAPQHTHVFISNGFVVVVVVIIIIIVIVIIIIIIIIIPLYQKLGRVYRYKRK